ncbi:MAG: dihydrolipoyl dehydrogenase [Thermoproteota archaeon]
METVKDAVIIGGGPGGYAAAIKIAQLGGEAVIVEKGRLGGVCANYGCIPTKAMQASVKLLERLRRAERFAIHLENESISYAEIVKRRERLVDASVRGIERLLDSYGIPVVMGVGEPLSKSSVKVSEGGQTRRIEAKNVVLATGSLPQGMRELEFDGERVLTSDDMLALNAPPESLTIVGGGAVGLEFATIFKALGTRITVLEKMERILPSEDWEVSEFMRRRMGRAGIEVMTGCQVKGLGRDGLEVKTREGTKAIWSEKILVAIGRKPRINPGELARLGVKFSDRGIEVDRRMETNVKGIYAVGDVTGQPFLAHAAFAEGMACARNVMGGEAKIDLGKVPSCVYTIPEAASVGITTGGIEEESGYKVGRFPFAANAEARALDETEGFVKVLVDRESNALVGAHAVGPAAAEIIAAATVAIALGADAGKMKECVIAHPTVTEALIEAVRDADREALHAPGKDL